MENEKKYTFGDIIDAILAIAGLGITAISCFMALTGDDFIVSKMLFFLQTLGLALGATGITRRLLRQKQQKIEELETHLPKNLLSNNTPQNTPNNFFPAPNHKATNYEDSLEARFLEALIHKKGKITMVEAVILLRESIDKIIPIVEKLQNKGIIGTEISENGQLVYVSI